MSFETGKRDHILTPQEILLRTKGGVARKYLARPYTPLAIQKGASIAEVAALRQGEQSIVVYSNITEFDMPFGFRLEELDSEGNTRHLVL